jgi:hypothetical protein
MNLPVRLVVLFLQYPTALHSPYLLISSIFPHILQAIFSMEVLGPRAFEPGFSYDFRHYVLDLLRYLDFAFAFPAYGINPHNNERIIHLVKPRCESLQGHHSGRATIFASGIRVGETGHFMLFMIGCSVDNPASFSTAWTSGVTRL